MNDPQFSYNLPCQSQPKSLVIYCRFTETLIRAAVRHTSHGQRHLPLAVTEGRFVRAICSQAATAGIVLGMSVIQARRFCPVLTTVPLEAVDPYAETSAFLDTLADITLTVEPDGPDAAYAVLDRSQFRMAEAAISNPLNGLGPCPCIVGYGASRIAARACAECGLTNDRLADAAVGWLWPDDARIVAALRRLGLDTFGQVAAVGEGALFYQFGKTGRLLHRRASSQDLIPACPLWPPLRADALLNLDEYPTAGRSS